MSDLVKAVSVAGVSGTIALYLVYYLVVTTSTAHATIIAAQAQAGAYLAQICRNTAPAPEDRRECDRISSR